MKNRIEAAIEWLDQVTDPDGGVHRWLHLQKGLGPVSTEITGYAAHLFAWLHLATRNPNYLDRARLHAEWIVRLLDENGGWFLPYEPGSDLTYFFDCGIAARGLRMVDLARADWRLSDAAAFIEVTMLRFRQRGSMLYRPICDREWNAAGPHGGPGCEYRWSNLPGAWQRKAALLANGGGNPLASFWTLPLPHAGYDADESHPIAYAAEVAYLTGDSDNKLDLLGRWLKSYAIVRCDATAQRLRLHALNGESITGPIEDQLMGFQHETGGFHFRRHAWDSMSDDLSTHATIFAIQAMMLAGDPGPKGLGVFAIV